jgi:transcriptional regulator with XRE-family HTH domain
MTRNQRGITMRAVGSVIRTLRENSGYSLKALAAKLHWSHGRLSKYENDKLAVSLEIIEEIAKALNISPITIVYKCLELRYPKMKSSSAGKLFGQIASIAEERQ